MSRARGMSVVLALATAASAGAAERKPARTELAKRRVPGLVTVDYVTAARVYLDRGAEDGLGVAESLPFMRGGRAAGECRIETLGPHSATCTGAQLRPGDTAVLRAMEAKGEGKAPVRPLPPVPPPEELWEQREQVVRRELPLVKAKVEQPLGLVRAHRSSAALIHESWVSAASDRGRWHQERLQLAIRGVPIAAGTRLLVDLSTVRWTRRPLTFISPHRAQTQLFVHEAAVTRRESGDSWVLSAGRVWPWRAASLGVLDGAQVGWRSEDGALEVGGYGGVVPDALNLAPDLDFARPVFGAYWAYTRAGDGAVRWLQQEARVGYAAEPSRMEAEILTSAALARWVDVGMNLRLVLGPRDRLIDVARFDLRTHPGAHIELYAAARYEAAPMEVLPAVGAVPLGHRSLRADAGGYWKAAGWLRAGMSGGYSRDIENDALRGWAGPEVQMPALLGGRLGLFASYQEEIGWMEGRGAWLQAVVRPAARLDLLGRLSWIQSGPVDGPQGAEAGTYLRARYVVARAWDVSIAMLTRWRIEPAADVPSFGITGTGALATQF
jgi:hypothetical protein